MADRVHPEPPPLAKHPGISPEEKTPPPPSGSFVIQLPKDQIYRVPPLENAYHFNFYRRRAAKRQRRSCCRCLALSAAVLFLLLIALAAAVGILYLVFLPKIPSYSIESLSIRGLNLSSAAAGAAISPEIGLSVRSENPNKKIGIYYRDGSSAAVAFSGDVIARGAWPPFYQGKRNVTVVQTVLKGSGIRLPDSGIRSLTAAVNRRQVPLEVSAEVPVRVKLGAVTSWTITVKLRCEVTVDKFAADSRVVDKSCRVRARLVQGSQIHVKLEGT